MKLDTKKEKVQFLKRLVKGQADLAEILPEQIEVWFQSFDETGFDNHKGQFLTNAEFEAMPPKPGNHTKIIVFYRSVKRDKPID
jgi:hypothetical protein